MKADYARSLRINGLYLKAITGNYTWAQLKTEALKLGVTGSTAKSYLDAVEARLNKKGMLKQD